MRLIGTRREKPWRYKDENFKSNNGVSHLTSHWMASSVYLPMDWREIISKDWSNEQMVTLGSIAWQRRDQNSSVELVFKLQTSHFIFWSTPI